MNKIIIITGSRAEYGLLRLLIKKIKKIKKFSTKLVVTGSHLSKTHGYTIEEIRKDNIKIDYKVDLKIKKDFANDITNSVAIGLKHISKIFLKEKPNLIILLGDRYELMAPALAALIHRIPIGHIHGGEVTNGAYDDAIRHSISKMSNLHFVSNIAYKKRLMQLGENKKDIFVTGGMGVDAIKNMKFTKKKDLEQKLNIKFDKKNILITFHPVTKFIGETKFYIKNLLGALSKLKDTTLIFTCANADNENLVINNGIKKFVKKKIKFYFFYSLGQQNYYSCLRYADVIIGNSSSGILEAPTFKIGTINIGSRQHGRLLAKSVINTGYKKNSIKKALKKVFSKNFKLKIKLAKNPYGNGGATDNIIRILSKKRKFDVKKTFYDLET